MHCRTLDNAATYPLRRLQARPRSSCLTQNSVGLLRTRFPTTMLSLSWINLPNISISGLINPRSENIVQILVATFTLLALLPRSFYFQSILCDRLNLRLADPQVYDFHRMFSQVKSCHESKDQVTNDSFTIWDSTFRKQNRCTTESWSSKQSSAGHYYMQHSNDES